MSRFSWFCFLITISVGGSLSYAADSSPNPATFRDCADCPEMVVIPAGRSLMGSPPDETGRADDEGPRHRVDVPRCALGNCSEHVKGGGSWYSFPEDIRSANRYKNRSTERFSFLGFRVARSMPLIPSQP